MDLHIKVSVCCITYNHAGFIKDCLNSFLMQKTNFAFEILIHDDASTDGTEQIIREYEAKYPNLIKPLYEVENQWKKGRKGSSVFNFPRAKGKYIALCEGDDYWTDPHKLQKQVDFLETNPDYSMCFHSAALLDMDNIGRAGLYHNIQSKEYFIQQIYRDWIVPTASVVFRRDALTNKYFNRILNPDFVFGDTLLFMSLAEVGRIHAFKEQMSVYRIHTLGVTQNPHLHNAIKWLKHHESILKEFNKDCAQDAKYKISELSFKIALRKLKQYEFDSIYYGIKSFSYSPKIFFLNLKSLF